MAWGLQGIDLVRRINEQLIQSLRRSRPMTWAIRVAAGCGSLRLPLRRRGLFGPAWSPAVCALRSDPLHEFGFPDGRKRRRSVRAIHRTALHEDCLVDAMRLRIVEEFVEQVAAAGMIPQVMMGIADSQFRLERLFFSAALGGSALRLRRRPLPFSPSRPQHPSVAFCSPRRRSPFLVSWFPGFLSGYSGQGRCPWISALPGIAA